MQISTQARDDRPDYSGPACDHASRVGVSIRRLSAGETSEVVARLPVSLFGVPANAALPRRVARIDEADRDPGALGLVTDLRLKIGEGPRVQRAPLYPTSPDPLANALEILKSNPAIGAFGTSDDLLGNAVIDVVGEALLFSPPLLEQPLGALRSLALEALTKTKGTAAKTVEMPAAEVLTTARGRDVDYTDVDAEPAFDLLLFGVWYVHGDEQIPAAIAKSEIGLTPFVREQRALALTADERNPLAPSDCPEARGLTAPRKNSSVIGDRSERLEDSPLEFVQLVTVGDLGDAAHDDLRRQVGEGCAAVMVGESVDRKLAKCGRVEREIREPVAGCIRAPKSGFERARLNFAGSKLHLDRQLHVETVHSQPFETQEGRRFLLRLKAGVSTPNI